MQPRSYIISGYSAHEPTNSVRREQLPNSGRAAQETDRFRQFSLQGHNAHKPSSSVEVFNCSTQATQPKSCPTQTLDSGNAAKRLIRFMQNNAKGTSKNRSGKKEYLFRKRLHTSWVSGPTQKVYRKKKRSENRRQASKNVHGRSGIRRRSKG